jgi:DeoR family ulaG and ulaABCDEF operon transcriptional repressor
VLVDSSKFDAPAGHAVCDLSEINIVVTDKRLTQPNLDMLIQAGIELIVA